MGTLERRSFRFTTGVGEVTLSTTLALISAFLHTPRNTRTSLTHAHGSWVSTESVTEGSNNAIWGIYKGNASVPAVWSALDILWAVQSKRAIVGTPSNQESHRPGNHFEIEMAGHPNTSDLSKGAASNVISGWGIAGQSSGSDFTMMMDITIEFVDEWLDSGGSKFDQNEEEEF